MKSIALVDDHYIVRQGLEFLIATKDDFQVVGSYGRGKDLLSALQINEINPQLILVDLVMPEMNGIELIHEIKKSYPHIKVLVLTSYVDDEHVMSALEEGADGYQMKDVEAEQLISAIDQVIAGARVVHKEAEAVMNNVVTKPHHVNKLSKRETEVLKEMVKGKTNKEIAAHLFVSEKTIKTHVSHIFNKLQVSDRTQAAIYAMENNLI
ncbi:response regulator [Staphylococcus agnetis]|uniref:DNA-binding response regulator n=1 Tax=Staphylococcus agnetis TaxID=985762 RepID=A0ABX3Z0P4_9STAP|nr:response regulator transcription factor [Staphylococcus agnetis]ALN76823.1 response regulator transcription factor [Staphylococcus agnetis]MDG4944660.1 response regulator transcription factor [Staphylococcus agnetis]OSP22659.1 DNA-binding response regulator [Staphylococcus agnetis]OSP23049.1 DNA-binding response regulator [Staphylococcus agnetis]OTW30446.1 DNA-binding response regulator [Staphylococcus agnetis]